MMIMMEKMMMLAVVLTHGQVGVMRNTMGVLYNRSVNQVAK